MRVLAPALAVSFFLLAACTGTGGPDSLLGPPPRYICFRADPPPVVDGRAEEEVWRRAPWTDLFVDIEGHIRPSPRFATRAAMLWDDVHFYVMAVLEEPHVWGTLTERDSIIYRDNDFEVFIDPDGDRREYYELEVNALNTVFDLFLERTYREGGQADIPWDITGLRTGVWVDGTLNDPRDLDHGWSVEIAIPWKALEAYAHRPCPPRPGDRWRVNFSRVEWQHQVVEEAYVKVEGLREDNWVWSPQGQVDMHLPERWGVVEFAAVAPPLP